MPFGRPLPFWQVDFWKKCRMAKIALPVGRPLPFWQVDFWKKCSMAKVALPLGRPLPFRQVNFWKCCRQANFALPIWQVGDLTLARSIPGRSEAERQRWKCVVQCVFATVQKTKLTSAASTVDPAAAC